MSLLFSFLSYAVNFDITFIFFVLKAAKLSISSELSRFKLTAVDIALLDRSSFLHV